MKFIFRLYVGNKKSVKEFNELDGENLMSTNVLKEVIKEMYGKGYFSSNQAKSIVKNMFEGYLNLDEFEKYMAKYQYLLFPALLFQKNLRYNTSSHITMSISLFLAFSFSQYHNFTF